LAVYMLIDVTVREGDLYAQYIEQVREVVERHRGKYLARGGEVSVLSGDWHPGRLVLIEFPTMDDLRACFASPEYAALAPLRERSTVSRAITVEGVAL
jgi:uncharacterized protein (DUF1330 family)